MDLLGNLSLRRDYSSKDEGKADDNFIYYRVSKVSIPHRDYYLLEKQAASLVLRISESEALFSNGLYTLSNGSAIMEESFRKKDLMIPSKQQPAIAIISYLLELVYYLNQRIDSLESKVSQVEDIKEIRESINILMFDYRYQKARNNDLESELSFFKTPED